MEDITLNRGEIMKIFVVIISLFLFGCFGAELFKLGGIGIKTGDIITVPHKIETLTKEKK
jgi:hypothetical protein